MYAPVFQKVHERNSCILKGIYLVQDVVAKKNENVETAGHVTLATCH